MDNRAANNSQSSDNGRPKFANVRRNRNRGRTLCPENLQMADRVWNRKPSSIEYVMYARL